MSVAERSRVKAFMLVHLFGQCAEMEPILETARKSNLAVIEDADQAIGLYYPLPLHVQDCFKYLGHRPEDFRQSVDEATTTLALPIYPELQREQLEVVEQKIKEFLSVGH